MENNTNNTNNINNNKSNPNNIKIVPLGGVEEIGINSTLFEYRDQIVVIDLGAGFPDSDMYGVDFIIPNFEYLAKNKHKIKGVLITHGHLDHIGAIKYILPRIGFPKIYGTRFTIELIRADLKEAGILDQSRLEVIDENSHLELGDIKARFFRVNHSIPQCVGINLRTPAGSIVHTGDFKFDNSPVNEPLAEYGKLVHLGEEGVDLLLADSTNSFRKGYPISETEVARSLELTIERAKGRVIIASFSGLVGRLYQVMQIAQRQKRKVAIAGYSMNETIKIAQEIGYIKPEKDLIVPIQSINRFHDDRVLILTTGAQGESNAALYRMASDEYKNVKLKRGDTVVISAGTIPGNNVAVQDLIDKISATGAVVHQSESMDFFTSGHGYQEDQKIMLNLVKPKYFMPVHGYQYFLREHGRTGVSVGVKEQNVIISKRGSIIEGNSKDGFTINGQMRMTPVLVSGMGVGDIGESVLSERQQLGRHGVIVLDITIDPDKRKLLHEPFVVTRGFVYVKTSKDLLTEVRAQAIKVLNNTLGKTTELAELRTQLEDNLGKFVEKEIGRRPMILPVISFQSSSGGHVPRQPKIQKPRKPLVANDKLITGNPIPGSDAKQKVDPSQSNTQQSQPSQKDIAAKWKIPQDSLELLDAKEL